MKLFSSYVAAALLFIAWSCNAGVTDIQIVKGKCGKISHIAKGRVGEDLTKRQSRFFCDSAIIGFFDDNGHIMVQFAKKSRGSVLLGFAGIMQDDGILNVSSVYLGSKRVQVSNGYCKFLFKNKQMISVVCGASVDERGRRTVPIVEFNAAPRQ